MHRIISLFLIVFVLLSFSSKLSVADEYYYTWKDNDEVTHITDDINKIPPKYKNSSKQYKKNVRGLIPNIKKYYNITSIYLNKYKQFITIFFTLLIFYFIIRKIISESKDRRLFKKTSYNNELISNSGIKNKSSDDFKKTIKEILIKNNYKLDNSELTYNPVIDYIGTKGNKKYAISINSNVNSIPKHMVNEVESEKYKYNCSDSMIIARTSFDEQAIEFAKKVGCCIYDDTHTARIIMNKAKF